MTLATTAPVVDYIENGVTLVHIIPFQFETADEIVCTRIPDGGVEIGLVPDADYTVSGGGGVGGLVTKISAGVPGAVFRIRRVTTRAQLTDYAAHDSFPAEVAEAALDRLAAVNQEQDVESRFLERRTLHVQPGEDLDPLAVPSARLGTVLGFNDVDGKTELLTKSALATVLAPVLAQLLGAYAKGDPGGNVMAIGLFVAAAALNIPLGTDAVRSSGYSTVGKGIADYVYDAAVDAAYVAANPRSSFRTANARGFKLAPPMFLPVEQLGAVRNGELGGGATDDHAAIQAATDLRRAAGGGWIVYELGQYRCDHQVFLDDAQIHQLGAGKNVQPGTGTRIKFPAGLTGGFRWQNGPDAFGEGSSVEQMVLEGTAAIAVSDADAQLGIGTGLLCQCPSTIRDVLCIGWEGNGAMLLTPFGSGAGLNANNCTIDGLHCWFNLKNGFATYGSDSNNGLFGLVDCLGNGQFGYYENGQLGNSCGDLHTAGNVIGALRLGDITRNNRIRMYKEIGTILAVQIDAGGAGGNEIDLRTVEGDGVTPAAIVDNSGTNTNTWNVGCVKNEGRFGLANPNIGIVNLGNNGIAVYKGAAFVQHNVDSSSIWQTYIDATGRRWVLTNTDDELWWVIDGALSARMDSTGLNLGGGKVLRVDSTQVIGPRQGALTELSHCAGAAPTAAEFNAAVDAWNDWVLKAANHGLAK